MQAFSFQLINGYPILDVDGMKVLLNTGSAESMGTPGELTIAGKLSPLKRSTLRLAPDILGKQIGTPVDVMLGADILTQYDFKLLPEKMQVVFTSGEFHPYGYCNYFELFNGVPITPVSVFDQDIRLFFVTGSRRTYLIRELLKKINPTGTTIRLLPGSGIF